MRAFGYARPESLEEAIGLLEEHGSEAMLLAGGTDLMLGLRGGWSKPRIVVDLKRVRELAPGIEESDAGLTVSAATVMTDITEDRRMQQRFPALVEAAVVVGSVQIRNRATLAGNICNCSPAADTAPPLMVYGAVVIAAGPAGTRRIPVEEFMVGPGKTALAAAELVAAIEIPFPPEPYGAAYLRHTRRKGTDLASVTLACGVDASGTTRLAYGSMGPRPFLEIDGTGVLADPKVPDEAKAPLFETIFAKASPSPTSMRSGPEYRLAMLRVLGARALRTAIERLAEGGSK
ncbi:MAG: xanthine dehydrogenase family protein subunit M [Actinobacteria bacterium]|nr:xanthine dehydrogenase family protein subunit M [Actinomycetota bacterium]